MQKELDSISNQGTPQEEQQHKLLQTSNLLGYESFSDLKIVLYCQEMTGTELLGWRKN